MKHSFTIPSPGNEITHNDIKESMLRITVDFKKYFPSKHCDVTVEINSKRNRARLTCPENRSYRLRLGQEMMTRLGVKPGGSVKITVLGEKTYRLEKK